MEIKDLVIQKPRFNALAKKLRTLRLETNRRQQVIHLPGLCCSSAATFLAPLKNAVTGIYLFVLNDEEEAAYFYHDLCQITDEERVLFFPSAYKRSIRYGQIDPANEILRTEVVGTVQHLPSDSCLLIVSYPEALAEKVAMQDDVSGKLLHLTSGQSVESKAVVSKLNDLGFERVDYVYEPGQFAIRGSILDVFSFSSEYPFRIDFFGNEIDSLRTFEVDTQLSKEVLRELTIAPSLSQSAAKGVSLPEYLGGEAVMVVRDLPWILDQVEHVCNMELSAQLLASEEGDLTAGQKVVNFQAFRSAFLPCHRIEIGTRCSLDTSIYNNVSKKELPSLSSIGFHTTPQPQWHKNFDLIAKDFRQYVMDGYTIHILSESPKQLDRIEAIFRDRGDNFHFVRVLRAVHEGFVDDDTRNCYFTDHEIFDRYHKYSLKSERARSGKLALSLKELQEFNIGDYIVHVDHGIGQFGGLVEMPMTLPDGTVRRQEVVKLIYKNQDQLYVSIHQLDKLSKYRGRDANPPVLSRLGGGAWEKLKDKTTTKMKDMARELITLYAKRKKEQGYKFSPDTNMQQELEASFIYEETPDQLKATNDVKRDMESVKPMDRLICGDVGFGKTEVAIRAALKACADCKQVAVLVPTTVLAFQHYKTFSERLRDFPVRVDYLSRARSAKQTTQILKDLKSGDINIIVGTHKLIGKSVEFNDLGLLVIDEEQKFGVKTKEALKKLRVSVDTLTMTATPIPRTLQFSLMGARDLSIIATPPANRYPIQTEVHRDDDELLTEAINFELSRNGQVFFINNRITQLPDIVERIHRLVPDARVAYAHGQMDPEKVEEIILDFANYEYDVLVCTTIIEAGLDMPNANTMIVSNAQNFGLSELHQLRGRVGRTNKKAFCYLLCPPLSALTPDARRRLQAIENFSGLGSGIHLAMQDLDIRGAGNIFGGEQSGFITELGYEAYQKILRKAINDLKSEEFADLYKEELETRKLDIVDDANLETDLDLQFGEEYVPESGERIALYQELDNLTRAEEIDAYKKRLIDRFGPIPESGEELIRVVTLRSLARQLGFERLVLRQGLYAHPKVRKNQEQMRCFFPSEENKLNIFLKSDAYNHIMSFMSKFPQDFQFEQRSKGRYSIVLLRVNSIKDAIEWLQKMLEA